MPARGDSRLKDQVSLNAGQLPDDDREVRALAYAHIVESAELKRRIADERLDSVLRAANLITECFQRGNKVLLCGNGGSAADAQHIAAEFVNRLSKDFDRPGLPAIALTTDTSFITAYANDFGYDGVFERQLRALGREGDVLVGISTSGNSINVIKAVEAAREMRLVTIGLIGEGGGMALLVDHPVLIPSRDTQHIQEALLTIEHVICVLVERALFAPE